MPATYSMRLDIWVKKSFPLFLKKRFYLFIFREREKERERNIGGERNINWLPLAHAQTATSACALTGNQTSEPSLCGMMPNRVILIRASLFYFPSHR